MTTTEKLFVQIFDRKNRITEQVKQRTDLYRQHLASKILLDGYDPPLWLWNPNFNSRSSDPQGSKKEELISELLLSHSRSAVPCSGGHYSAYDKPVVVSNNVELSSGLFMGTHASRKGFNTGDRPSTLRDNDIECALNSVPEWDLNATSHQAQDGAWIPETYPDDDFNARDRPTTMTECHDVGCSFNCVPDFDTSATSLERLAEVRLSYSHSDNGLNVGDMPTSLPNCYDNDLHDALNFDPEMSNGAASPLGQTEVRMIMTYTAPDQSLARLQRSKSRQKALEIRNSAKAAAKSRYAPENVTSACYRGNKKSIMVSPQIDHDIELFGLANYFDDTVRANSAVRQAVGECQGTAKNPNTYDGRMTRSRSSHNLSSHESIAKEDGCPMIRSQSPCTEGKLKPVGSSYTVSKRVTRSKSGASKEPPQENSLNLMERFHLHNVPGSEAVPHCPDSAAIVKNDVNAINIVETEVISNGLLEASHESIAKEDGCPMIRSQSTSTEGTSKPVSSSYAAGQRVTRSKASASGKLSLDNSLNRTEQFHLINVLGSEAVLPCPDSSAIVNKDGNADNIDETEVVSDGLLEAQAVISKSNLDLAGPSVRFEASISRPPPVFGTFVKPKTLDFGDMEKCLNKISGPMLEKGRLEKSAPKMSTPVKSAVSHDKATFSNTSGKSLMKQSLEPNASNNKTESWRISSETCVDECVGHNEDVSNNLTYVADKSKSVQEIQHSHVSDGPDKLLSNAGKGFDEKYMVQVQECELGHDGRDENGTTPFPFKNQKLGPSFGWTKHSSTAQGCRVGEVGVTNRSSSGLDLSYCCAEDSQVSKYLQKSSGKVKMSRMVWRERALLEKESHAVEDDLLAFSSSDSLHRRLRPAAENSWPQFKRGKVESQQGNFSLAPPSFRAEEIHCIRVGGNLGTDIQSHYEGDVALSSGDRSSGMEKHWEVKYNLTQEIEPSAVLQLEQDELGFEKRNPGSDATSAFKNGQLGTSILSGFMNDTTEGFQDCSFENVETADSTRIYLDGRMPGDELHYINKLHSGNDVALENEDDLTHSERMLQETEPHFEVSFSHSSIVSPQDKHLDSLDADQTMPEFEGFIIGSEEDGGSDIAGDGFSLDKLDLPSAAIERASILEQLCRSASMHTPLPKFSTAFKLHRTPGVYQSVPNGLLEHTDLRSTFNLNDDGKQLRASYSNVGEVKSGFQGSSLSGGVPYSDPHFNWSLKEHPMSPVGNPWDWFSVNSSSSEKERSSNPELTCFPIEEDPNNSEENENGDEDADTIQEDACSTLLNSGAKREPFAELKAHANPPTSVSAVEEFPDRSTLDSADTEVSVTEAHSKVRQPTGNCNNNKRRCTNEAKENIHFSVSTNNDTKATKSRNSRFSKSKLVGKASLRKDMQGLLEREPKHNNIVTNVTSFVPFVQQKQAATITTGKRDIKVKALEAAEAAKRLEEKKGNERKMKKEALKLERAKTEQENLRQMELKMKMKQEEQKKKDADVAARKRLREEEERKEKERKRQRTDMRRQLRDQGDKLRNRKVEKEVPISTVDKKVIYRTQSDEELRKVQKMGNKQGDDNVSKKQQELGASEVLASNLRQAALKDCETFPRCVDTREPTSVLSKSTESNDLVEKTSREKSYEISPYQCSDDEDEEEDEIPTTKYIPSWASKTSVALVLSSQQNIDPDIIFPPESFCSSDEASEITAEIGGNVCVLGLKEHVTIALMRSTVPRKGFYRAISEEFTSRSGKEQNLFVTDVLPVLGKVIFLES